MKKISVIMVVLLSLAGGAFALWSGQKSITPPTAPQTQTSPLQQLRAVAPAADAVVRRCVQGGKKKGHPMRFMRGEHLIWEKKSTQVMQLPGTVPALKGRHKGQLGLPLTSLVPNREAAEGIDGPIVFEVVPCTGEPRRYMRGELAGLGSNGLLLIITPRGILKLMDMRHADGVLAVKNIYAVRIRGKSKLPGGGSGQGK